MVISKKRTHGQVTHEATHCNSAKSFWREECDGNIGTQNTLIRRVTVGERIMKTAICFVPHLDDELLVGGGFLYAMAKDSDWNVKVVFATNGDYFKNEIGIRLHEAIESCKVLGIQEDDIIFLGYGDQWKGKHLYNSIGICESYAGRTCTYALEKHKEFRTHEYTRDNYLKDIVEIIRIYYPDVIICVDYDEHPDHRALSLLFSEALKEVLSEDIEYRPLVLKKLAYETGMYGKRDYYKVPMVPTQSTNNSLVSTPVLKWDERICFEMPKECQTTLLSQNPLYQAAKCHRTQIIRHYMMSAINSDIVYWRLHTENLALLASIQGSSGDVSYINDLKTIDSKDLCEKKGDLDASVWIPDKDDEQKQLVFIWDDIVSIHEIEIYENPNVQKNINRLTVIINHECKQIDNLRHDGSATKISFSNPIKTTKLEIRIMEADMEAGLSEVMIYGKVRDISSYGLPCKEIRSVDEKKREDYSLAQRGLRFVEHACLGVIFICHKLFGSKYDVWKRFPDIECVEKIGVRHWVQYTVWRIGKKVNRRG